MYQTHLFHLTIKVSSKQSFKNSLKIQVSSWLPRKNFGFVPWLFEFIQRRLKGILKGKEFGSSKSIWKFKVTNELHHPIFKLQFIKASIYSSSKIHYKYPTPFTISKNILQKWEIHLKMHIFILIIAFCVALSCLKCNLSLLPSSLSSSWPNRRIVTCHDLCLLFQSKAILNIYTTKRKLRRRTLQKIP